MIQIPTISYEECESSYPELLATVKEIAPGLTDDQYAELVTLAVGVCQDCYKHERSDCECWEMVDRYKLHFGAYRTPRYTLGAKVECQARGDVTIVGTTDARIPWPVGKTSRAA